MLIKNQNGITLTEALVTLIILGILAGGLLSILGLNATETSEGVLSSRMQMQYENVIEQMSRDIRHSSFVLDQGAGEQFSGIASLTADNNSATHILMYDLNGNVTAGYNIRNDTLIELNTASGTWSAYKTGKNPAILTSSSHFRLAGGRKSVETRIHIKASYKNAADSLVSNANLISCRN